MDLINVKEIKKRIEGHRSEIAKLERLLEISASFGGAQQKSRAKAKAPAGRKRGKRGAVTNSILAALAEAPKPLTAGDLRNLLIEKGVVKKGSTTVYAMLMQMSKKGTIKKTKSAQGTVYSAAPAKK